MRPPPHVVLLLFLSSSATAQTTAGLSAGYLFSGAPGVEASCGHGRAVSADAWLARPVTASGHLSVQVSSRWVRPFRTPCDVYANLPGAAPLPIRPDGVYEFGQYGSPWFARSFGTIESRLRFHPWPHTDLAPRVTAGGGWAWRLDTPDQPFAVGGVGLGLPVGAVRVAWDVELWWMRVECQTVAETWLNAQPVSQVITAHSYEWQRAIALRITLEELF